MADYSEIIQEINTNLPDNTEQLITAEILRNTLIDFVNKVDSDEDDIEDSINRKQDLLTFDNTPTENSDNPVTSNGIYDVLQEISSKKQIEEYETAEDFPETGESNILYIEKENDKLYYWKEDEYKNLNKNITPLQNITWENLVELRNNSQLVPGTWYRITDYECTTSQEYTTSANHQFDIIVRADSENKLNENAYAANHTGDTYFANCNLEAWELKYCLENDTNRFAWADSTNGKGVIYYMKDEWNNECPYDFKNIMFKRWAVTECDSCPDLVVDGEANPYGYYYGAMQLDGESQVLGNATYGEDSGWFYTFALKDLASDEWYDYTVVAHLGLKNDEDIEVACYDNHIVEGTDENNYNSGKGEMTKMLNNIVFFNCYGDLSDTSYSDDYSYCNNNRFLGNCQSNTFGNNFKSNSLGNNCNRNTLGNNCNRNSLGNNCNRNTLGNDCNRNTLGNNCQSNSFGNNCQSNSFGNYCYRNTLGNYCQTITVFDGVQNCSVTGGTQQAPVKNAQILNGTAGAPILTITFAANKNYTQVAGMTTDGTLRIWNPADPS